MPNIRFGSNCKLVKRVGSVREESVKTRLYTSNTIKPKLSRLWLRDHIAHLIRNLYMGSEWGPMVDHGSTGPIRNGPPFGPLSKYLKT